MKPAHGQEKKQRCHLDMSHIWSQAWTYTKKNVRQFSILIVLVVLTHVINSGFDGQNKTVSPEMEVIISFLSVLLSLLAAWLTMGLIQVALKILRGEDTNFSDGIIDFTRTGKAFVASILSSIFGMLTALPLVTILLISHTHIETLTNSEVGFLILLAILLFVPILYVGIRLNYTSTAILDKNVGIWQSIVNSWKITKNHVACLFIINLVTGALQILGVLTLGIGLFRTIPFMIFSQTITYIILRDHYLGNN